MVTMAALLERDGLAELTVIIDVAPAVAGWVPPAGRTDPADGAAARRPGCSAGAGDPLVPIDPATTWPAVPRIDLTRWTPGTELGSDSAAELANARLDIIIQPVGRPVVALAAHARHGVWGFEHGGSGSRQTAPGLAAVLAAHDTLRSELVAVGADGRRTVLARTWSAPDPTSVRRFMDHVLAKLAPYPARVVARMARQPERDDRRPRDRTVDRRTGSSRRRGRRRPPIEPSPGPCPDTSAGCRTAPGAIHPPARWLLAELPGRPGGRPAGPVDAARPDSSAHRSGTAGPIPFPVDHDGARHVFMEEWSPTTRKGRIALLTRARRRVVGAAPGSSSNATCTCPTRSSSSGRASGT